MEWAPKLKSGVEIEPLLPPPLDPAIARYGELLMKLAQAISGGLALTEEEKAELATYDMEVE